MEELNKNTLIESLSSLPEYDPPEGLWEAIYEQVEKETDTPYSRQDLRQLPEHNPPEDLWGKIESKLEKQEGKVMPIGVRRIMAIAASLALLLAAYWVFNQEPIKGAQPMADEGTISYSTEVVDEFIVKKDWNEDEDAFEEFEQLCEAKKYVCEHPEFQVLKSDLNELTEAKEAIQEAIGSYGTDPELVTQIKEIELERTDILKKMMVMLI